METQCWSSHPDELQHGGRKPTIGKLDLATTQSTPDDSNLQGKSKKVRVIGSSRSYPELEDNSREYGKKKTVLLHSEHFNHI